MIKKKLESGDKPKFKSRMKPKAWKSIGCDFIKDGGRLYNRCHLIGCQLATKKVDKRGVITGTRYFNVEGMYIEEMVADYIEHNSDYHILYRVTPHYKEDGDLLPYGVQMAECLFMKCRTALNGQDSIDIFYGI